MGPDSVSTDISELPAGRFRSKISAEGKSHDVFASRLTWTTWNEVCEILDFKKLGCYGVWVNPETGTYAKEKINEKFTDIGLVFPDEVMWRLVRQDAWVCQEVDVTPYTAPFFLDDSTFRHQYERISD